MGLANAATEEPRLLADVGTRAYNALTGSNARNPVPTYEAPPFPEPQGLWQQGARAIGQGVPSLPLLGAGAAAEAPTALAAIGRGIGSMASNALPMAGGQIAGAIGAQMAPEPYRGAAQAGGALLGGALAGGVQTGLGALGGAITGPLGAAGVGRGIKFQGAGGEPVSATATQADIAAARLRQAAESGTPGGAERFEHLLATAPEQIVPGSQPTTAQIAPLTGIAKLEDTVRAASGAPFLARGTQQSQAQTAAIQQVRPDFNPAAAGQIFHEGLANIDALGQQTTAAARANVQQATEGLGGFGSPQAYGQGMRGEVQGALDPVQQARRALWQAFNPDGTLALDASHVGQIAAELRGQITPSDAMSLREQAVLDHASQMNGVVYANDLQNLRSNVLDAQRQSAFNEPLSTRAMARLQALKQGIDATFSNAANGIANQEAQAVAAGTLSPEQTLLARLMEWRNNAAAAESSDVGAGLSGSEGAGGSQRSGPVPNTGNAGAAGQAGAGFGGAARAQGVPGQPPLTANFDQAAAETMAAAREATFREKERFARGATGRILAQGKAGAPHAVLDADVPSQYFTGGPAEPEHVQNYITAVGGAPRALALAKDYLVSDLRRNNIIDQDGIVNRDALARWTQRRAETMKLFPGLSEEFANADAAQRAYDGVQAAHTAALKEYQNGVAKYFLQDEPWRAVQKILGSSDRVKLMQQAIGRMQGNPDAIASLQGHVVDYILSKLTSGPKASEANALAPSLDGTGALRADAFQSWVRDNKPWLRRLFEGGQGMQNLEMVGADLRRQQLRSIATVGSPTEERRIDTARHGALKQHLPTVLALIGEKIAETGASVMGLHGVAGLATEALGATLPVLAHTLRQHGIQTVNDLVREAMLHPSVARELMARPKPQTLGNVLQRRVARAMQAAAVAQSGVPPQ